MDATDRESPVYQQYGVTSIPYFAIYNEKGKPVTLDADAGRKYVHDLIQRAGRTRK